MNYLEGIWTSFKNGKTGCNINTSIQHKLNLKYTTKQVPALTWSPSGCIYSALTRFTGSWNTQ